MTILKTLAALAAFILSLALIFIGQANRGPVWLGVMLLGLAGLLALLWLYNRRYTRAERADRKRLREGDPYGKK